MGKTAILTVKILSDASQASKGTDQAASRMGKFSSAMSKAAVPAAALGGALVLAGKKAVDAASRTQQAMGGVDAVFGKNAGTVKKWAAGAAQSIGLAKSEYGELATVIGSQLKNAGLPMDQVTKKTGDLITMGGDLAAMFGGTTKEAVEAMSSALKGEMDPMEKYGVTLNDAAIKAEMAAQGTDKLTGKQAQSAKTAATLALITKQTGDAQGAAAREHDSAAAAQQRLNATTENMASTMGTILLPAAAGVADALSGVATWASKNVTTVQILAGVIGGLAAAVLITVGALKVWQAVTAAAAVVQGVMAAVTGAGTAALQGNTIALAAYNVATKLAAAGQWALNAAMSANPIALVIIAIVALIAVFVILYKKSETFRRFVDKLWQGIKAGAKAAANIVKTVWNAVWAALKAYVRAYLAVFKLVFTVIKAIGRTVATAVKAIWRAVWAALKAYVRTYLAVFRVVFQAVKGIAKTIGTAVRTTWQAVMDAVKAAVRSVKAVATAAFNAVRDAVNTVKTKVDNLIGRLKDIKVPGAVVSAFNAVKDAVQTVIDAVGRLVDAIGRIKMPKLSFPKIPSIFTRAAPATVTPAPSGFAARTTATATPRASTGTPGGVTINVHGALDPEATARQIHRILAGHDRRVGLRPA